MDNYTSAYMAWHIRISTGDYSTEESTVDVVVFARVRAKAIRGKVFCQRNCHRIRDR